MLNTLVTRLITIRMRNWECLVRVVHVCARDRFPVQIVGNATMATRNNTEIYEEVYRFMITFFIYKDNVFRISQIF